MAKCEHKGCQQKKIEGLGRWCIQHYIANKSKAQDPEDPSFYSLQSEAKLQVGKSAFALVKTTDGWIDEDGEYESTSDYLGSALLARIATAVAQKPCVAVCLIGSMLIIGYNSKQFDLSQWESMRSALRKAKRCTVNSVFLVTEGRGRLLCLTGKARPIAVTDTTVVDLRPGIHAEMRVLGVVDHLRENGGLFTHVMGERAELDAGYTNDFDMSNTALLNDEVESGAIWIYVNKPCCAKCETVMRAYDQDQARLSIARTGYHTSYDWDWRLPVPLRWLERQIEYSVLKKAVGKA